VPSGNSDVASLLMVCKGHGKEEDANYFTLKRGEMAHWVPHMMNLLHGLRVIGIM